MSVLSDLKLHFNVFRWQLLPISLYISSRLLSASCSLVKTLFP